jgi:predicted ATPase
MGYPEQSQQRLDSAYSLAKELAHTTTTFSTLSICLLTYALRRDEDRLEQTAKELLHIAENEKMHDSLTMARGLSGWLTYRRGDQQEGLKLMRELIDKRLELGTAWIPIPISLISESLAEMGERQEALSLLDDSISLGQRDDTRWCEAELYRIKGRLLLGDTTQAPSAAEQAFNQAIELAREQNAKSLELRAAVDLARLWQTRGNADQARDLLRPIYDWFTEGLDTPDLTKARALLEALV